MDTTMQQDVTTAMRLKSVVVSACLLISASIAWAEDAPEAMDHSEHMMDTEQMDHSGHTMDSDEMDHSGHTIDSEEMDHSGHNMDSGETDNSEHMMDSEEMDHSGHTMDSDEMDHSEHAGHATATAETAPAAGDDGLRDPHAYAEGEDFGPLGQIHLADQHNFGAVLVHRLEAVKTDDNSWFAFEGQGWYGRTYDRANLKLEGEVDDGKFHELRTELLWSHAVAPFWDSQLGVRFDSGEDPDRTWAAIGIQGLAPYWFHVDATFYVGEHGDTAGRIAAEYDLLFTQRLILQPKIEANLYGQNDEVRETGSGLSHLSVGLRLRYEFTRQFAPYVGVEWGGQYGGTADYAREANSPTNETSWVVGVHMWF